MFSHDVYFHCNGDRCPLCNIEESRCCTAVKRRNYRTETIYTVCSRSILSNDKTSGLVLWQYVHSKLDTIYTISQNAKTTVDACDALPGFQPTLVGGDGDAVQNCKSITSNLYWADYSCRAKTLSVTGRIRTPWLSLMKERIPQNCEKSILKRNRHWSSSSLSILTDVNIVKEPLNATLFPGIPSTVQVHDGFRDEHALTALQILEEVKRLMTVHNTQTVTCVCRSYIKPL